MIAVYLTITCNNSQHASLVIENFILLDIPPCTQLFKMKYIGKNDEYFEIFNASQEDYRLIEKSKPSELSVLWFQSDDNKLIIDNVSHTFGTNDIVCLTEFHKVKVAHISEAYALKWNKQFYCIINHDSEVGCKGILFYGAVTLPVIHPSSSDVETLTYVWRTLEHEMVSKNALQGEMLQMMLKKMLIHCTRIYADQTCLKELENEDVDIIREYHFLVEKHFKAKHTVAEYAEMLCKSPKTLSNTFRKLGSRSPLQFIKDRKMLEARRLLIYTAKTVSDISYELGFSDVQSFSRFFKKEEGFSPVDFRKKEKLTTTQEI